jgi:hypothetical protein
MDTLPVQLSEETARAVREFLWPHRFLNLPDGTTPAPLEPAEQLDVSRFFRAVAWCVDEIRRYPETAHLAAFEPDGPAPDWSGPLLAGLAPGDDGTVIEGHEPAPVGMAAPPIAGVRTSGAGDEPRNDPPREPEGENRPPG